MSLNLNLAIPVKMQHVVVLVVLLLYEKCKRNKTPHSYRLFLCLEMGSPNLPSNLIRQSRLYVFEPPSGMKASLQRSFAGPLQTANCDTPPVDMVKMSTTSLLFFKNSFCSLIV